MIEQELLTNGDTGLGTFENANGEMIVVDGHCYRASDNNCYFSHKNIPSKKDWNMKKLALCAMSLLAAAALVACGDDSSSSGSDLPSCKYSFNSDSTSFKMEVKYDGITNEIETTLNADHTMYSVTQNFKGASEAFFNKECEETKATARPLAATASEKTKVVCEKTTMSIISMTNGEPAMIALLFKLETEVEMSHCFSMMNGEEEDSIDVE